MTLLSESSEALLPAPQYQLPVVPLPGHSGQHPGRYLTHNCPSAIAEPGFIEQADKAKVAIALVKCGFFNANYIAMVIRKYKQVIRIMEYALFITLGAFGFLLALYVWRKIRKPSTRFQPFDSDGTPVKGYRTDGFSCHRQADRTYRPAFTPRENRA